MPNATLPPALKRRLEAIVWRKALSRPAGRWQDDPRYDHSDLISDSDLVWYA